MRYTGAKTSHATVIYPQDRVMSIETYRRNVAQLTRKKADIDKQISQYNANIARLEGQIASIVRSITPSTSLSIRQSKQRQIESKQRELVKLQKKVVYLATKSSQQLEEINRKLKSLERAEQQQIKKQELEKNRKQAQELQRARQMTRETEKQARLHAELASRQFVIDISMLPTKIKVLFLTSNPQDQTQLRLDEEVRSIKQKIRASQYRDSVELVSEWAVRPSDILQALNENKPHIVHFSGHGSSADELVLQNDAGLTQVVTKEAIVATMKTMIDNICLVVFNTCFSSGQAEAVTQHVDIAIGMADTIGDEAARIFAAQFYSAIGFGRSVQAAFDQGQAALMLEGIPEEDTPVLFCRAGVNPADVVLVRPVELDSYEQESVSELEVKDNSNSAFLLPMAGLGTSAEDDISERDEEILADEIDPIHGWSFKSDQ